ncbi:MAG: tRNA (adenosine(37)-N6)-dimethylallyltransferase MiaA [Gammaproteobacteria bacterium]
MGPTAAGKTDVAIRLCDEYPFEIISVDSSLVYRRLNIGSAKPPPTVMSKYPHHLVDICEPHEPYSAADFRRDALAAIADILERGKIPLLVGGTGLYFRTLERGIAAIPEIPPALRERLRAECDQQGSIEMHKQLQSVDPPSALRIHPHDPQRILRALEIFHVSGRTMSEYLDQQSLQRCPYEVLKTVLAPAQKSLLHAPIRQRFEKMLAAGFINEVLSLKQDPRLTAQTPAIRAVGYRAVWRYLNGEISRTQMVHDGVVATRRLAKRQYTWFRSESHCTWVDPGAADSFDQLRMLINREVFST